MFQLTSVAELTVLSQLSLFEIEIDDILHLGHVQPDPHRKGLLDESPPLTGPLMAVTRTN